MKRPMNREILARGFTALRQLHFECEPESGICTLVLELARDETFSADIVRPVFSDVSRLQVRGIGGGLPQVFLLSIEDRKEDQLDRMRFFVSELENENISFHCTRFVVEH
jgi:hypothetical protein